jgi:TolB protein
MKKRIFIGVGFGAALAAALLFGQNADINANIVGGANKPALAVIDFHGAGGADPLMKAFNSTLMADLQSSALFDLKSKSFFPASYPQQPSDLVPQDNGQGKALSDWSGPPVSASHLVFGYAAVVNGVLAVYGNVYDTRQAVAAAKVFAQRYAGSSDEAGAVRIAHEFANDIIVQFGGTGSLLNSRIYFVSDRGAAKGGRELWVMDWDGKNQKQLTKLGALMAYPAISFDGSRLACTIWPLSGNPSPVIAMVDSQTGRKLPFYNQAASLNAAATFTPDGTGVFYSSSASGEAQIYSAKVDGRDFTRVTQTKGNPSEPKVNPKNADSLLFVQGFPNEQIYRMNAEGLNIERLTEGTGEAANPSWSPDGQHIAFAWTRGYQAGEFNIFMMDVGSHNYQQLTHDSGGKNENPVWAPDGKHIVFMRTPRSGRSQIYSMLADGTQVTQLTTQGTNRYPVWGVK